MSRVLVQVRLESQDYEWLSQYANGRQASIEAAVAELIARRGKGKAGAPKANQNASKRPSDAVVEGLRYQIKNKMLTYEDAGDLWGVRPQTVMRWCKAHHPVASQLARPGLAGDDSSQ